MKTIEELEHQILELDIEARKRSKEADKRSKEADERLAKLEKFIDKETKDTKKLEEMILLENGVKELNKLQKLKNMLNQK